MSQVGRVSREMYVFTSKNYLRLWSKHTNSQVTFTYKQIQDPVTTNAWGGEEENDRKLPIKICRDEERHTHRGKKRKAAMISTGTINQKSFHYQKGHQKHRVAASNLVGKYNT